MLDRRSWRPSRARIFLPLLRVGVCKCTMFEFSSLVLSLPVLSFLADCKSAIAVYQLTMNRVSSHQTLLAPPRDGYNREMCRPHGCVKDGIDFGSPQHRPTNSILKHTTKAGTYIVMHDWTEMLDSNGNEVGGPVAGKHVPRLSETRQEALTQAMR